VVAGGSLAKLGMKFQSHLEKGMPVLEDVLASFAVLLGPASKGNACIRLDSAAFHRVGAGASPQGMAEALAEAPLKKLGMKLTDVDRVENIRRIAEVAKLMVDAGLIVLTAFISPFRSERRMARGLLPEGEFIEVFVDTPLALAESRDPKGLYKKARAGELKNFTGIDSPYEEPEAAEIRVNTSAMSAEQAADTIIVTLQRLGIIGSA